MINKEFFCNSCRHHKPLTEKASLDGRKPTCKSCQARAIRYANADKIVIGKKRDGSPKTLQEETQRRYRETAKTYHNSTFRKS